MTKALSKMPKGFADFEQRLCRVRMKALATLNKGFVGFL
jgi:hypothetical protein